MLTGFSAPHGKENILDHFYATRLGSRFHPALMVGAGSNDSHRLSKLVDRLSQRLVLAVLSVRTTFLPDK